MPDIDTLSGQELDAAVTEEVLGISIRVVPPDMALSPSIFPTKPKPISSDWAAHGLLVERLEHLGFLWAMEQTLCESKMRSSIVYGVRVRVSPGVSGYGHSRDLREALGRAALKAVRAREAMA